MSESFATNETTIESSSRNDTVGVLKTLAWTLVFLVSLDVGVNFAFPYPSDPLETKPPRLALYFEYGRSVEGKLKRMIGDTNETTALIARAGWLNDEDQLGKLPVRAEQADGICIAAYGMSFTEHVCQAAQKQDPRITLRQRGGPAAPLNHSYALFVDDLDRHEADVAVLGILASSFPAFQTQAHMTWNFEFPSAYSYPRFEFANNRLNRVSTSAKSLAEFRSIANNTEEWDSFCQQLANNDAYYDEFLFRSGPSDQSAVMRMLRRAWWQRHKRLVDESLHNTDGFVDVNHSLETARYLVVDFAAKAREKGMLPVVLVFNDRGYSDHLYQVLAPSLKEHSIAHVSTHETAPASDLSNFLPDGHFRHELDEEFGKQLRAVLKKQLNWPTSDRPLRLVEATH